MAESIISAVEGSLDPRSVTNALYETMVEWRSCVIEIEQAATASRAKRLRKKREWIERMIGRFINRDAEETRTLLSNHFFDGQKR
jgi:hypothetical protein